MPAMPFDERRTMSPRHPNAAGRLDMDIIDPLQTAAGVRDELVPFGRQISKDFGRPLRGGPTARHESSAERASQMGAPLMVRTPTEEPPPPPPPPLEGMPAMPFDERRTMSPRHPNADGQLDMDIIDPLQTAAGVRDEIELYRRTASKDFGRPLRGGPTQPESSEERASQWGAPMMVHTPTEEPPPRPVPLEEMAMRGMSKSSSPRSTRAAGRLDMDAIEPLRTAAGLRLDMELHERSQLDAQGPLRLQPSPQTESLVARSSRSDPALTPEARRTRERFAGLLVDSWQSGALEEAFQRLERARPENLLLAAGPSAGADRQPAREQQTARAVASETGGSGEWSAADGFRLWGVARAIRRERELDEGSRKSSGADSGRSGSSSTPVRSFSKESLDGEVDCVVSEFLGGADSLRGSSNSVH